MSMSTRIEDLPGSIPDDIRDDIHNIQNNIQNNIRYQEEDVVRLNTLQNQNIPGIENDMALQKTSNITASIKKRVKFEDDDDTSFIEFLKNEVNEENLLLFIILIFATRNDFDGFILRVPFINKYTDSSFTVILLRCLLLLLCYIVLRHYVVPKIKL
jgi:hypothetical protein